MVCGDPKSGTGHSLKEVSAYISWYRVHTWGLQGKCHKLCSVNFCVKNASAESTCYMAKEMLNDLRGSIVFALISP